MSARDFLHIAGLRWLIIGATALCAAGLPAPDCESAMGPRLRPGSALETTATVATSAPVAIYPSKAGRYLPRHQAPAGPREPDSMLPQDSVGLLTSDYFLQAVMSLSWKDDQGTILCSGTYEERAVPPSSPAADDRAITVRIQERWDECPVRPHDVDARVQMDRITGQWLTEGGEVTDRWGWSPTVAEPKAHSAYFEIVPQQPVPVFTVHSDGQGVEADAAYDRNGLWVWALRREDVPAGSNPAATVWEGWMVTSTSRLIQATAGLAASPVHEAWWANRVWLGPYAATPDEFVALQKFTGGQMIWREGNRVIYVLRSLDSAYRPFADTWTEETAICPGADRLQPPVIRGFGNVWCLNEGGFARSIGVPKEIEEGRDTTVLLCAGGQVIRSRDLGDITLLPDGTWTLSP